MNEIIGLIGIIIMLIFLFMGIPVVFVLAFIGFIGYAIVAGWAPAINTIGMSLFSSIGEYGFSVLPLFLIMGYFIFHSGVVTDIFNTVRKWVGHLPGGLAIATVIGGAGMGAVSGSGIAATATLAKITIPEMIKAGIDKRLAYGVVASAGPLAQMIPPSTLIVMYAIIAEQSVGKMLIAGLVPGIVLAVLYVIAVLITVKINPNFAKPIPKTSLKERIVSLKQIWSFALLALIIIGGIYSGIFTPTEAGAIGAFSSIILLIVLRKINKEIITNTVLETVKTTSMVFFIVSTAYIFGQFLAVTRIPSVVTEFLAGLQIPGIFILIIIIIMYLLLGMIFDMLAAMFITLPIILPVIELLGYDLIWFGIIMVLLAEISLVTPPLGLSLFVIKGAIPESNIKDIIKGSIPFIIFDLVAIALFIMFPELITFLPNLMK